MWNILFSAEESNKPARRGIVASLKSAFFFATVGFMNAKDKTDPKLYYFIDIDPFSRQIVSWDIETKDQVEVHLKNGCYRVFLSKGQYNKLVAKLEEARS